MRGNYSRDYVRVADTASACDAICGRNPKRCGEGALHSANPGWEQTWVPVTDLPSAAKAALYLLYLRRD